MALLHKMNGEGNSNQIVSEQGPEESEGHLDVWEKIFQAEGAAGQVRDQPLRRGRARNTQDDSRKVILSGNEGEHE